MRAAVRERHVSLQTAPPSEDEMAGNSPRGFAAMDRQKQRAIASKGGQSVPPENRSFSRDHGLAAAAGRKGGENGHGAPADAGVRSEGTGSRRDR
jgi:general stress protein YciG